MAARVRGCFRKHSSLYRYSEVSTFRRYNAVLLWDEYLNNFGSKTVLKNLGPEFIWIYITRYVENEFILKICIMKWNVSYNVFVIFFPLGIFQSLPGLVIMFPKQNFGTYRFYSDGGMLWGTSATVPVTISTSFVFCNCLYWQKNKKLSILRRMDSFSKKKTF